LSSVDLTVSVSEAGGLGSFGVHHLDATGTLDVAARMRSRTQRPFALNLWLPHEDSEEPRVDDAAWHRYLAELLPFFAELELPLPERPHRFTPPFKEQLEAVLEARPAAFRLVFGVPDPETVERPHARHTTLTRAFRGRLARRVVNRFVEHFTDRDASFAPYPVQGWLTGTLKSPAIEARRTDLMALRAGRAAPLLRQRRAYWGNDRLEDAIGAAIAHAVHVN
jgi:NAD(P)H-dependent flavin oxidoreductase YrpB (nitropropane dioxygenase family)